MREDGAHFLRTFFRENTKDVTIMKSILRFSGYEIRAHIKWWCAIKTGFLSILSIAIAGLSIWMAKTITVELSLFYLGVIFYKYSILTYEEFQHRSKNKRFNKSRTEALQKYTGISTYYIVVSCFIISLAIIYIIAFCYVQDQKTAFIYTVVIGVAYDFLGNLMNNIICVYNGGRIEYKN